MTTEQKTTKPDGWHTYHVCGGLLQEVRRIAVPGRTVQLMCVYCGDWCQVKTSREEVRSEDGELVTE